MQREENDESCIQFRFHVEQMNDIDAKPPLYCKSYTYLYSKRIYPALILCIQHFRLN